MVSFMVATSLYNIFERCIHGFPSNCRYIYRHCGVAASTPVYAYSKVIMVWLCHSMLQWMDTGVISTVWLLLWTFFHISHGTHVQKFLATGTQGHWAMGVCASSALVADAKLFSVVIVSIFNPTSSTGSSSSSTYSLHHILPEYSFCWTVGEQHPSYH